MKLDPRVASGPLVALVALLLISLQTADAIRRTSAPKQDPIAKRPTAIIWDNDPRASIRWNGRDYVVKANSQVSDYQVILIGRDQVLLAHGDESLVLRMHRKGD